MSVSPSDRPDSERSRLRAIVATLEQEIAQLPKPMAAADGTTPPDAMRASWAQLVAILALGPEPEVRECPVCKHVGMRMATVCGYCWTKLTPPV
jgi:hypothetical protein